MADSVNLLCKAQSHKKKKKKKKVHKAFIPGVPEAGCCSKG